MTADPERVAAEAAARGTRVIVTGRVHRDYYDSASRLVHRALRDRPTPHLVVGDERHPGHIDTVHTYPQWDGRVVFTVPCPDPGGPLCAHPGQHQRGDGRAECVPAGPEHNAMRVRYGADLVLVLPGDPGSEDLVRHAQQAGVPVLRLEGPGLDAGPVRRVRVQVDTTGRGWRRRALQAWQRAAAAQGVAVLGAEVAQDRDVLARVEFEHEPGPHVLALDRSSRERAVVCALPVLAVPGPVPEREPEVEGPWPAVQAGDVRSVHGSEVLEPQEETWARLARFWQSDYEHAFRDRLQPFLAGFTEDHTPVMECEEGWFVLRRRVFDLVYTLVYAQPCPYTRARGPVSGDER